MRPYGFHSRAICGADCGAGGRARDGCLSEKTEKCKNVDFIRGPFVGLFVGNKVVPGMARRIFRKNAPKPPSPILLEGNSACFSIP